MLEPELLLGAYSRGIFPMAMNKAGEIGWFSPDPRAIIPLDDRFHVPHGLRRALKKCRFTITLNRDFEAVMRACAQRREGTWISEEIVASYCRLHQLGFAHSVEVWEGAPSTHDSPLSTAPLAGGLYGVAIGGAFFGESMFHRVTDASKVALVILVERLRERGFTLLDTQWRTPHLAQFGTCEIPRQEYLRLLRAALALDCQF